MKDVLTVSEYCKKYKKDPGNVRKLLINKRLKGKKLGNQWIIEESEVPPKDKRVKTGKYINSKYKQLKDNNPKLIKDIKSMSKELCIHYKDSLIKIVVYGSYARNKQTEDSDVDIAMFVKNKIDRKKLIEISSKYELETGKVLSVVDIDYNQYKKYKKTLPLYKNIEKEGIEIWKNNKY